MLALLVGLVLGICFSLAMLILFVQHTFDEQDKERFPHGFSQAEIDRRTCRHIDKTPQSNTVI